MSELNTWRCLSAAPCLLAKTGNYSVQYSSAGRTLQPRTKHQGTSSMEMKMALQKYICRYGILVRLDGVLAHVTRTYAMQGQHSDRLTEV